jgi:hypothetical protein
MRQLELTALVEAIKVALTPQASATSWRHAARVVARVVNTIDDDDEALDFYREAGTEERVKKLKSVRNITRGDGRHRFGGTFNYVSTRGFRRIWWDGGGTIIGASEQISIKKGKVTRSLFNQSVDRHQVAQLENRLEQTIDPRERIYLELEIGARSQALQQVQAAMAGLDRSMEALAKMRAADKAAA